MGDIYDLWIRKRGGGISSSIEEGVSRKHYPYALCGPFRSFIAGRVIGVLTKSGALMLHEQGVVAKQGGRVLSEADEIERFYEQGRVEEGLY